MNTLNNKKNNNMFYMNTFCYKKNNNIYNTNSNIFYINTSNCWIFVIILQAHFLFL